jgi:hypothetical protein
MNIIEKRTCLLSSSSSLYRIIINESYYCFSCYTYCYIFFILTEEEIFIKYNDILNTITTSYSKDICSELWKSIKYILRASRFEYFRRSQIRAIDKIQKIYSFHLIQKIIPSLLKNQIYSYSPIVSTSKRFLLILKDEKMQISTYSLLPYLDSIILINSQLCFIKESKSSILF